MWYYWIPNLTFWNVITTMLIGNHDIYEHVCGYVTRETRKSLLWRNRLSLWHNAALFWIVEFYLDYFFRAVCGLGHEQQSRKGKQRESEWGLEPHGRNGIYDKEKIVLQAVVWAMSDQMWTWVCGPELAWGSFSLCAVYIRRQGDREGGGPLLLRSWTGINQSTTAICWTNVTVKEKGLLLGQLKTIEMQRQW